MLLIVIYPKQALQSKHEDLPVSSISQVMKTVWKVKKIAEEEQNMIWLILASSRTQISQSLNGVDRTQEDKNVQFRYHSQLFTLFGPLRIVPVLHKMWQWCCLRSCVDGDVTIIHPGLKMQLLDRGLCTCGEPHW